MKIEMTVIGKVSTARGFRILVDEPWRQGLTGLQGFSHVMILWAPHELPPWDNSALIVDKPYRLAPEKLGIFATRSPWRPSGICVSIAGITGIREDKGELELGWVDAQEDSPVLDIKPYHPSSDRVERPALPRWCRHWPASLETGGEFDWEKEFLF